MAGMKRTDAQRDVDLRDVARMYLRENKTQAEIASWLGDNRPYQITQQMVSYDLRKLRKMWVKSALVDFNDARARELAKIDQVELESWQAWEASKSLITIRGRGEDDAIVTQKETPGDPSFLSGIRDCIKMRVQLLGLDAPKLLAVVDEDFDQETWSKERATRHAAALDALDEAENGEVE